MSRFRMLSVHARRSLLGAAALAVTTVLVSSCSSSSGSSGSSGSSDAPAPSGSGSGRAAPTASVAPDAGIQAIAQALGCTPSGSPTSPSASSGGSSIFSGATVQACTRSGAKFAILTFGSVEQKRNALGSIGALAGDTGAAFCGSGQWLVAADVNADDKLSPAQLKTQHRQLTTAHRALGCRIKRLKSGAKKVPAPTSAPGAKLPADAQGKTIAAKLGCSEDVSGGSATINGAKEQDVNCTKDGLRYDIQVAADDQGFRTLRSYRSGVEKGHGVQTCTSGLWSVQALFDGGSDGSDQPLTQDQRATQTKQMNAAHDALGCTVRTL